MYALTFAVPVFSFFVMSGRNTRSNSVTDAGKQPNRASLSSVFSLADVKTLIQESESRIISKLESIVTRIIQIDEKIDRLKADQIRIDLEVNAVKRIVVAQQQAIETHETEKRQRNLIFSAVPEPDVLVRDDECEQYLKRDAEKVTFLCKTVSLWEL